MLKRARIIIKCSKILYILYASNTQHPQRVAILYPGLLVPLKVMMKLTLLISLPDISDIQMVVLQIKPGLF